MSRSRFSVVLLCAGLGAAWSLPAQSQKPIAYPAKGQSQAQQQQDDGACYAWAKSNTGIDPAAVAAAPPTQQGGPAVGGGERAGGAARGALGGAVIGGIAGDAGKGAAAGAAVGTMAGGHRARQNQRNAQANAQQQQSGAMSTYYRAYSACMQGRGYTIQ
ncbi:glycine zipper domain-containing protein [Cupriavidus agavae]|uniref:Outer membrane protein with glycine zipper n=1 Tax=Cupriavidus agavae TaxID=1001822 RepID=A0A4Q7RVC9_9BURK|nr:glycine zipper domain-containing protein [Cupriavidus agavae]RZT36808.1 outer membrane protein with glycine zipper [Cupriavidus agavae]